MGQLLRLKGIDKKYWRHWSIYAKLWQRSPLLDDATQLERVVILTAFAQRVRTGFYGRGNQVTVQTVAKSLAAISTTVELAGEISPVYKAPETYLLPISRLIEGMRREDPLPRPQLAISVRVIWMAFKIAAAVTCTRTKAIADLTIIAFFYLLRVGEYTQPRYTTRNGKRVKATRTIQFRVKDVGFHAGQNVMDPHRTSLEQLLAFTSATLRISN